MRRILLAAALLAAPPAWAHEWYSQLRNPKGDLCCNQQDCQPVEPCLLDSGGIGVAIGGACRPIPPENVLPLPSPDGQMHACLWKGETRPRCVILGGGA